MGEDRGGFAELVPFAKRGFAPSGAALSLSHLSPCGSRLIPLVSSFDSLHQQQISWEGREFFVCLNMKPPPGRRRWTRGLL